MITFVWKEGFYDIGKNGFQRWMPVDGVGDFALPMPVHDVIRIDGKWGMLSCRIGGQFEKAVPFSGIQRG